MSYNKFLKSFEALKKYCENEQFKGWDPYDGLNSVIFNHTILKKYKYSRLAWIQFFKRNPINLRSFFLIKKDFNPKGLGLFLTGYCNLFKVFDEKKYIDRIKYLSNKLLDLKSEGYSGFCWGYNFDWQARAFYQPKFTPTVVATSFIGNALLDAYEILKDDRLLSAAKSACDFILEDLNRSYDIDKNFAFSYSPLDHTQVINASLLGCKLLSRVFHYTGNEIFLEEAKKSVQFCIKHQRKDGSWPYGTLPYHQWIDNFHTGYNLECIFEYQKYSNDFSFNKNLDLGLDYYVNTFFLVDGKSKYYSNKVYPIDIHSPAQLVVTLYRLDKLSNYKPLVDKVLNWSIDHMQDPEGFFYYQKRKILSSRIPYIRWAQAWMFYAFSFYLLHEDNQKK